MTKFRPGDKVTIEGEIVRYSYNYDCNLPYDAGYELDVFIKQSTSNNPVVYATIRGDQVVTHTPKSLKVGDRVKTHTGNTCCYKIVAIVENYAMIKSDDNYYAWPLKDLVRSED